MISVSTAPDDFVLRIDDDLPPFSTVLITALDGLCDHVEDAAGTGRLTLRLGTVPPTTGPVGIHEVNKWERVLHRLERAPAVTIAVVEQDCAGPTFEALLACDYRIARTGTQLSPPTAQGAPWPGMAIHRLATQLGAAYARRLVLFGTEMTATEAFHSGLVDVVTDDVEQALSEADSLTEPLLGTEVAVRRRLLLEASSTSFDESLGTHLSACDRALRRAADAEGAVAP